VVSPKPYNGGYTQEEHKAPARRREAEETSSYSPSSVPRPMKSPSNYQYKPSFDNSKYRKVNKPRGRRADGLNVAEEDASFNSTTLAQSDRYPYEAPAETQFQHPAAPSGHQYLQQSAQTGGSKSSTSALEDLDEDLMASIMADTS
jgi:hypothetical protein